MRLNEQLRWRYLQGHTVLPDLVALELLIAVADCGSIREAAATLSLSQPSASARLQRLERTLGVELFFRSPTGTSLTEAGESVARMARSILRQIADLNDGIERLKDRRQILAIAATNTVANYWLPSWLQELFKSGERPEISLQSTSSARTRDLVLEGKVEIGFVRGIFAPRRLSGKLICKEELVFVKAPKRTEISKPYLRAHIADIQKIPLIVLNRETETRNFIDKQLTQRGLSANILFDLSTTEAIKRALLAGSGTGIVSRKAVEAELASKQLIEIRYDGLQLQREIWSIWSSRRSLSSLASKLISLASALEGLH